MTPRALFVGMAVLFLAATGRASDRPDGPPALPEADPAARISAEIRPWVVRVEGIDPGGRTIPSAGVVLSPGEFVLTWSRFAREGWLASVVRPGGQRLRGRVAARDAATGITLVKLDEPAGGGLVPGDDRLPAGSPVLAAGHPFGGEQADAGPAVSLMVIAQARAEAEPAGGPPTRYLLSGAVNPGDYGGPLVGPAGALVGLLLPGQDRPSGLSQAAALGAVRNLFADVSGASAALAAPAAPPVKPEWLMHDALRAAASRAWPAVASLVIGPTPESDAVEVASAVLVDAEGHLVTTAAPATGAPVMVVFPDRTERLARIVAADEKLGLTVLAVDPEGLPAPIELAPEKPRVGSFVAAIGNPNGRRTELGPLITMGIIGARDRWDRRYGALHTDAAVNPANAGGALVDLSGRLVGVLSTFGGDSLTGYGANSGIGFAISSAALVEVLPALTRGESIAWRPGYLGVQLDMDLRPEGGGVRIDLVQPGEAAAAAGLKAGDVVIAANGQAIEGIDDLRRVFSGFEAGERVRIAWRRGDEEMEADATLGEWRGAEPR